MCTENLTGIIFSNLTYKLHNGVLINSAVKKSEKSLNNNSMEDVRKLSDDDDYSTDEEEIARDFDKEAQLIINSETLPKKSSDRYLQVYESYKKWLNENQKYLSSCHENNLIMYFNSLKEKLKPSTLWSIWSMLKKTLNAKDQIDVNKFLNLKAILKSNSKGYKPVKSLILKWPEIERFIKEADNRVYLSYKVNINIYFSEIDKTLTL